MNKAHLEDQLHELKQLLGIDRLPDAMDDNFGEISQKALELNPALAKAWLDSVVAADIDEPLPAETSAAAVKRSANIRTLRRNAVSSAVPEEDSPSATVADSRRVTLFVAGGIFLLVLLFSGYSLIKNMNDSGAGIPQVVVQDPKVEAVVEELPVIAAEPAPAPIALPTLTAPLPERQAVTNRTDAEPAPVASAPAAAAPAPTQVEGQAALPEGTRIFHSNAATTTSSPALLYMDSSVQAQPAGSPTLVAAPAPAETAFLYGGESTLASNSPVIMQRNNNAAATTVLYQSGEQSSDNNSSGGATMIYQAPRTPTVASTPAPAAAPTIPTPGTQSNFLSNLEQLGDPAALEALLETNAKTPSNASAGIPSEELSPAMMANSLLTPDQVHRLGFADNSSAAEPETILVPANTAAAPGQLKMGEVIPGRLVTSATILDGIPAPVIISTSGEWCPVQNCPELVFIGTATLLGGNRVVINLHTVVRENGMLEQVQAIALSSAKNTSIPAIIRDETPTIAPDLLRSSLSGVSNYANLLMNQTRTIVGPAGEMIQESIMPDIASVIGGSIADALRLPPASTTVVRVAEVDPETPILVAIGLRY